MADKVLHLLFVINKHNPKAIDAFGIEHRAERNDHTLVHEFLPIAEVLLHNGFFLIRHGLCKIRAGRIQL